MKNLHKITHILLIIGGLNWLLIGLFDWGVSEILGTTIAKVVYILVGLAAVYELVTIKDCACCNAKETPKANPVS